MVRVQMSVIVETIINYHDRFNGSLHTGAWKLTELSLPHQLLQYGWIQRLMIPLGI